MRADARAKLNLALVVGPRRPDGKHELTTVYQRLALADELELEPAADLAVEGYPDDTLVRGALETIAAAAGVPARWRARIDKRIPVAAGLGGGSSDAGTALRLANESLASPLASGALHDLARSLGADVPFFLTEGPQLGEGDGSTLRPLDLPQDCAVVVCLPHGERKVATAAVYERFDARAGERGYAERRARLLEALAAVETDADLAALPANDLASSPLADELSSLGAFRADVTGAGPAVYGLFEDHLEAAEAARALEARGRVFLTRPAW